MTSRWLTAFALLVVLRGPASAAPRNHPIVGQHELSGGIGFAAGLSTFGLSGFKWFNDYSKRLSEIGWLNLQFNVTVGAGRCANDRCNQRGDGGVAVELGGGAKLKWRAAAIPLQIHVKLSAVADLLFYGDFAGVAVGFRGGPGVRYFFVPTFGVGVEFLTTFGPAFIRNAGVWFYGTIDMNFGVEWRF